MSETLHHAFAETPMGLVLAAFSESGLRSLEFGDSRVELLAALADRFPAATLLEAGSDADAPMAGIVAFITNPEARPEVSLDPYGSEFQKQVWKHLMTIPCGETRTYSDVAEALKRPEAVRAVASACGKNRIALFIPCHRVVRKDGSLGGFHWGLERKKALLENERQ